MDKSLKLTQKISLSGMLLAICFVVTIVAKTINMGNFFFVRLSFTPGIVVASSLIVGPFFGGLIGFLSDFLPALVYPTGTLNIFISLVYLLLGFLPYWLMKGIRKTNSLARVIIAAILLIATAVTLASLLYGTDLMDESLGDTIAWSKPLIVSLAGAVALLLIGLMIFFEKKKPNFMPSSCSLGEIGLLSIIMEVILMVVLKALAFYFFYEFLASGDNPFSFTFLLSMLLVFSLPEIILMALSLCICLSVNEKMLKIGIFS